MDDDGRIKLLIGITLSEMGGAQKVVYDLISSLPKEKYNITLVTYPGGELIQWIEDLSSEKGIRVRIIGISQIRREISPFYDIVTLFKLYKIMKTEKYDMAHFHSSKMGILGRLAARMAGVPRIYFTVHGWGINEYQSRWLQRVLGLAEKVAGRWCNLSICVSKYHMNLGLKMGWLKPNKACVLYNGIDMAPITRGRLRQELNIEENIPIIGTIMRLREPKQPVFTIEVFKEILNMGHKAKLIIIGDGPMYKDCRVSIDQLELNENVYLLGTRADARELINDIDIMTMFSKWEGLPIAIIEGMLAEKPVISSCVGGIPEIIDNGINGFMIDSFDVHEGAEYISSLLRDEDLMRSMGRAAKQKAVKCFSKDRMVENYDRIYREI